MNDITPPKKNHLGQGFLPKRIRDASLRRMNFLPTQLLGTQDYANTLGTIKDHIFKTCVIPALSKHVDGFLSEELFAAYKRKLVNQQRFTSDEDAAVDFKQDLMEQMKTVSDAQIDYALGVSLYDGAPNNPVIQSHGCLEIIDTALGNIEALFSELLTEEAGAKGRTYGLSCAKSITSCVNKGLHDYIDVSIAQNSGDSLSDLMRKRRTSDDLGR